MHRVLRLMAALCLIALVVGACGRGKDESTDAGGGLVVPGHAPSPAAANRVEGQIEEAKITITGGDVSEDQITLQEDQPTVLHVVNEDDTAYRLEIPGLVTPTEIKAKGQTDVSFTTPNTTDVEAKLLPSGEGEALDTFRVLVQAAGGVQSE